MQGRIIKGVVRAGLVAVLPLLVAMIATAQTGTITRSLIDPRGAAVPNAKVRAELKGQAAKPGGLTFKAVSNAEGRFTISTLPVGTYEIQVEADGFEHKFRQVRIAESQTITLDLQLTVVTACGESGGADIELTDSDKAEIIGQMLDHVLRDQRENGKQILLSTRSIKADWVRRLPGREIIILPFQKIVEKARPGEVLFYYFFSEFEIHGDCVAISFVEDGFTVVDGFTQGCGLCGSGATYVFHKISGKWVGKQFSGWIS
ncbi:MAG TPA: carboxypeptidase-like regulatory domain-containing protein [Blastocatellia bacterium]|nr:carboxypeptidase-like regulatory domain-containing protein [Blastocatellia bacterium]